MDGWMDESTVSVVGKKTTNNQPVDYRNMQKLVKIFFFFYDNVFYTVREKKTFHYSHFCHNIKKTNL